MSSGSHRKEAPTSRSAPLKLLGYLAIFGDYGSYVRRNQCIKKKVIANQLNTRKKAHEKPYKPIQIHPKPIQIHPDPSKTHPDPSRPIQTHTDPYRPIQTHTDPYRPIQTHRFLKNIHLHPPRTKYVTNPTIKAAR